MENNNGKQQHNIREQLKRAGSAVWRSVSYNLWYKLAAVVIAVLVWSYALTSNPSTTVYRNLNVDVTITGQTALNDRKLALATDLGSESIKATVRVAVTQGNFNSVTESNVRAELDLSSIRKPGKQQVRVRGYTPLGSVVTVTPDTLEIDIEAQDQRVLTVIPVISGKSDQYWYSDPTPNPQSIVVTGPASLVGRASQALVNLDLTGLTKSTNLRRENITLVDSQGEELPSWLSISTSSVQLSVDIYPTKKLPVNRDMNEVLVGSVPQGYRLESVDVQPDTIQVSADQVLLDSLSSVAIEPVNIDGATQTVTKRTRVKKLDEAIYSSETINVTVTITEDSLTKPFSNVSADLEGLRDGLKAKWSTPKLNVQVTGEYSVVNPLEREDLMAVVDLSEIEKPGIYELPIFVSVLKNPELAIEVTPAVPTVTVTEN